MTEASKIYFSKGFSCCPYYRVVRPLSRKTSTTALRYRTVERSSELTQDLKHGQRNIISELVAGPAGVKTCDSPKPCQQG